ncbi:hypothetical protein B0T20DRAFT_411530 [Sordaria brevicollis]|uniref:Uncharacterized protein n=1 Tax=Sordaria brevicollis TaxID=83679 RepID=A0AAE0PEV7_SORBR|nr:hypothetical protein B0T20DRAFT_411530 [Sordaria brevicollis]
MSSDSSHPMPGLLRLPTELRLEIYKHVWTIPRKKKYLFSRGYGWFLKAKYVEAQLSAIRTLGAICRTIRNEAYSEYFQTTQIYLGFSHYKNTFKGNDKKVLKLIENSYLLMTQARHICVLWDHNPNPNDLTNLDYKDVQHRNSRLVTVFKCLDTRFQNAITLEIILEDVFLFNNPTWSNWRSYGGESVLPLNIGYADFKAIPDSFYDDHHSERIRSLRFHQLEKAVVRTSQVLTDPDAIEWFNKDCRKWFERFESDLASLVTAKPKEEDKPESYIIKNHIGNLSPFWPLSDKV